MAILLHEVWWEPDGQGDWRRSICLAGPDYWGFSTKPKEAFGANGRLESTLEALAAIGYLERLPHGFVWTSLATTAMRCTYNWPLPDP
jgi:hypothetical protein